jgi:hypothetical protein
MTKNQRIRIGQLGAEWTVLDSEENVINRLIGQHYRASRPEGEQARELIMLLRHQRKLFKRKREISDELIAFESGVSVAKKHSRGRRPDAYVEVRNALIRRMKDRTAREICSALDLDLGRGGNAPPLGFPNNWFANYEVSSFKQAYKHSRCKNLVEKLISKAKEGY